MILRGNNMRNYLLLVLIGCLCQCFSKSTYTIFPMIFHFQSDIDDIKIENLSLILHGDNVGTIKINSTDFITCTSVNDTCEGRRGYTEVSDYTKTVPMTKEYDFSAIDNTMGLTVVLFDSSKMLLNKTYGFPLEIKIINILIYLGTIYDENNEKIMDFLTVTKGFGPGKTPTHVSFPIERISTSKDSLFLVWYN
jgi:hypothetical protein